MPRRRWEDPWQQFPASKPLAVEGGMSTSKRRGPMADAWWSKRFVDVLESYGLGARMQRGRRYARSGQVMSLDVTPGLIAAQVQGSRRTPYLVTVQSSQPSPSQWDEVDDAFAARVGFAAQLLAGEVPAELEEVFIEAGVPLFPRTWSDVRANCNCPDWENPCKHIAAVLYVYADQLDTDPWLLLLWRGRTRDEVLGHLGVTSRAGGLDNSVAPWWPLVPGRTPVGVARSEPGPARTSVAVVGAVPIAEPPTPAARVLVRMEPLDAEVGGAPLTDLLEVAYEAITAPAHPVVVHDRQPE
jgi:uncharacterized Zn finger protein